jgi:zinc transport system substrate-binding protein
VALLDAEGVLRDRFGDGSGAHDHDHDHDHEEAAHDHGSRPCTRPPRTTTTTTPRARREPRTTMTTATATTRPPRTTTTTTTAGVDPHAWLYPDNAKVWLSVIAADLSAADPANAATYAANAEAAALRIDAAVAEAAATLAPAHDKPIVVFHDAYGYFARAFDVEIAGSIALGDAAAPGAQRLRELQERIGRKRSPASSASPSTTPPSPNRSQRTRAWASARSTRRARR